MNFSQKVYALTKKIPKGKVTTYKQIAKAMKTKAYQAVGNALNKNRNKDVPCHRVVKSNGEVGGFAGGTNEKIRILEKEGIEIENGKVKHSRALLVLV